MGRGRAGTVSTSLPTSKEGVSLVKDFVQIGGLKVKRAAITAVKLGDRHQSVTIWASVTVLESYYPASTSNPETPGYPAALALYHEIEADEPGVGSPTL
jgi:hypothetical protein